MENKNLIYTILIVAVLIISADRIRETLYGVRIPKLDAKTVSFSKEIPFGATVDSASGKIGDGRDPVIDLDAAKKEIDSVSALGANLVRFNLERKTLEDAGEAVKLDEAINYAREKKMKIFLSYQGRESYLGFSSHPKGGGGKADWETFKQEYKTDTTSIMKRYKPDYMLILPECPYGIGGQIDSERTSEEWLNFAKEVGLSVKQISFYTKVVLEGTMLPEGTESSEMEFAGSVLDNNDIAINAFSMNAKNADELENGAKNLLAMKTKYHWNGEILIGDVGLASSGDAQKQKNFLLYAIHLTNSNHFSGMILSEMRDDSSSKNGVLMEDYSPKSSYLAIKEVLANSK